MSALLKVKPNKQVVDTDGIPPGMGLRDVELLGQTVKVEFSGKFYALNNRDVTFDRTCKVLYALRKSMVLVDQTNHNVYVIDRPSKISLGCLMHVRIFEGERRVV